MQATYTLSVMVVRDRAGWHIAQACLTRHDHVAPLAAYSPELKSIEHAWFYLRERFLSHRLFANYDAIVDACCHA